MKHDDPLRSSCTMMGAPSWEVLISFSVVGLDDLFQLGILNLF